LASNCEPKTMDSLRCSGGMPSTTPHFVGNDETLARATPHPEFQTGSPGILPGHSFNIHHSIVSRAKAQATILSARVMLATGWCLHGSLGFSPGNP